MPNLTDDDYDIALVAGDGLGDTVPLIGGVGSEGSGGGSGGPDPIVASDRSGGLVPLVTGGSGGHSSSCQWIRLIPTTCLQNATIQAII